MTKIDYFMTLNSPWAYLGSRRLIEIAKAKGATIDLKPTKFGPVFEVTGGLPLAEAGAGAARLSPDGTRSLAQIPRSATGA